MGAMTSQATLAPKRDRPQQAQEAFLSTPADLAIYGGAAGGGKSWALLFECLRRVNNPHFGAVIFRRTSPQITNEGGLWDESEKLYGGSGAVPYLGMLEWRFPSGATVSFRHLQHEDNKYDWDGSQVPLICFDELIHFTESQFFYLFARNRSTCGVRPYIRATTNPDATSWVKRFLAPWVDRTYPDPAASGEIRWFVRIDGEVRWARTKAELTERFPGSLPKSCTFVRASVFDNKILLSKDPGYLANLNALPEVERKRLLEGDWDVKREGLVYPRFSECIVPAFDPPVGMPCGGIDFGFNHPFCALAAVLDHDDVLWVWNEHYATQTTLPNHSGAMPRIGGRWYADPARPDSIMELRNANHDVIPCLHMGQKPILTGIDRVTDRIITGRLKVSRACINLIKESENYQYDPEKVKEEPVDAWNHALDSLRYLITGLDRGRAVMGLYKPPTPEEIEAEKDRLAQQKAAAHEERLNPDNDEWWPGMEDDGD